MPDEDPETIPTPADIAPIFLSLAVSEPEPETGSKLNARDYLTANESERPNS